MTENLSSGIFRQKIAPLKVTTPAMPLVNDDSDVEIEPVWSKSNIARFTRRHKFASKRCTRRTDILTRRMTTRATRTALKCSMHNEALGEFLEHLKKPKTVKLLEGLALAPCVSKCHSSASRAAEKLEERAIQRHWILHGSRTTSHLVDKETKKRRGKEPKITSVLSEELDCMKYIVLRGTYLGTTRKTAMKLDDYCTELEQFQAL